MVTPSISLCGCGCTCFRFGGCGCSGSSSCACHHHCAAYYLLQELPLHVRLLSRPTPALLPVLVRLPVLVVLLSPRRVFRALWSLLCQFVLQCCPHVPLALLALRACQMIASSLSSLHASHACVSHARAVAVLLPLLLRPWHGMAYCQRSRWIRMRFCCLPRRLCCVTFLIVRYVNRCGRRSTTPNFLSEGGGARQVCLP
jgi:hypothetical protein